MHPFRTLVRRSLLACLIALVAPAGGIACGGKLQPFDGNVAPGCTSTALATCSAQAYSCAPGSFPYGTEGVTLQCGSPVTGTGGNSDYCCSPSTGPQTSACTWSGSTTASCPTLPFRCKNGDDPATLDPQLTCGGGSPDADGTSTDYCCSYAADAATAG